MFEYNGLDVMNKRIKLSRIYEIDLKKAAMQKFPRTRIVLLRWASHHFARSNTAFWAAQPRHFNALCSLLVQCLLHRISIHRINCEMSIGF